MDKQRALELIDSLIKGIIASEESFDGEFGSNRDFDKILNDNDAPQDYFEALELKKMIENIPDKADIFSIVSEIEKGFDEYDIKELAEYSREQSKLLREQIESL